jgi:hypothetical protein
LDRGMIDIVYQTAKYRRNLFCTQQSQQKRTLLSLHKKTKKKIKKAYDSSRIRRKYRKMLTFLKQMLVIK